MLKMEEDFKISFLFDNAKDEQEESIEKDMIKSAPVVSDCPVCDGAIYIRQIFLLFVQRINEFPIRDPVISASPENYWIKKFP